MVTATTIALLVMPAGLAAAEEVVLGEAHHTGASAGEPYESGTGGGTEDGTESGTGNAHSVEVARSPDESAQESTQEPTHEPTAEPEVEIGEPHAVECTGAVSVTVVDLAGTPVPGGILMVAGEQLIDGGTVDTGCGETTASLLGIPDGYAVVGEASTAVVVRHKTATPVVFRVDAVEVLTAVVEAPESAPTAAPATPAASVDPEPVVEAVPTLARTGIDDPEVLALLAFLLIAAGTTILVRTADRATRA